MQKPKKWTEVYPQGTKDGDEENKFFKVLARHPQWQYVSVAHLAAGTNLARKRIEEIIAKYTDAARYDPPLIYAHPTQEDHWGYWERVPEHLEKDKRSITKKDQDSRVKKHIQGLDYVEVKPAPDALSLKEDDCGCDGSCDIIFKRKGILTRYGKKALEYTKMKSAYGTSLTMKDEHILKDFPPSKTIDPNVKITDKDLSQPACNKRWKRTELQSTQGHKIMKGDHLDAGQWAAPEDTPVEERWHAPSSDEDGWWPIRPEESKPIKYPNIYGFKTPEKHAWTMTDGPTENVILDNLPEDGKLFGDAPPEVAVTWNETAVDGWEGTKAGYSVQDTLGVTPPWNCESYNGVDIDDWRWEIMADDLEARWTVTDTANQIRDIPVEEETFTITLPEIPEIPEITIPIGEIPDVAIELPPIIFGTCIVDPEINEHAITTDRIDVSKNEDGWFLDV